ncbi:hypothetical protein HPP92_016764, partial [Vanilla planifolia]
MSKAQKARREERPTETMRARIILFMVPVMEPGFGTKFWLPLRARGYSVEAIDLGEAPAQIPGEFRRLLKLSSIPNRCWICCCFSTGEKLVLWPH